MRALPPPACPASFWLLGSLQSSCWTLSPSQHDPLMKGVNNYKNLWIYYSWKNTWGTVNLAVNIGAWACPRDMTTWKRLNSMFKQNNVLARYFIGNISDEHLIKRWNTRALVAFVEKSNWVCLVVAHLRERLLQSFGKYSVVGLEMRIRSPASVPRKNSNDPQNIDKKVPTFAYNVRNCSTTTLVGGWKRATIPTSSPGDCRPATEVFWQIQLIIYNKSVSYHISWI